MLDNNTSGTDINEDQIRTSTQTFMAGKHHEVAPKLNGLIPSSTTSILLASTPPMLPIWYLTDPSERPLLADCQRSNASNSNRSVYNKLY